MRPEAERLSSRSPGDATSEGAIGAFSSPSLARVREGLSEADVAALTQSLEEEVRKRTVQMRSLVTSLTLTEQSEARRISQVLHDDLQQVLCGIQMHVLLLREGTADDPKLEHWASQAHEWISEAIRITRQLAVDFSPPVLHDEGVAQALGWLAAHMEQMHGLHVQVEPDLPPDLRIGALAQVVYQIVRELLFNVVKHAGTDRAHVSVTMEDEALVLRVKDDGRGFDPDIETNRRAGYHLGLIGARERLGLFGGSLDIDSRPGDGTQVVLRLPFGTERT